MQSVRRSDTTPELALRSALHRMGLRFRVNRRLLANSRFRADIVFVSARVVVFVDGCFWHGCTEHRKLPIRNSEYWKSKIERNRTRDALTTAALKELGWEVVRVWEHEDPRVAALRVAETVARRRATLTHNS